MNIYHVMAAAILIAVLYIFSVLGWDDGYTPIMNFINGIMVFTMIGIFYWIPFWLIFIKGIPA